MLPISSAFKAYHSGTTFYFASERQEDQGKYVLWSTIMLTFLPHLSLFISLSISNSPSPPLSPSIYLPINLRYSSFPHLPVPTFLPPYKPSLFLTLLPPSLPLHPTLFLFLSLSPSLSLSLSNCFPHQLLYCCRWMNKMGLAAISYDASLDDTTAGFIRPSNPSSPIYSEECEGRVI